MRVSRCVARGPRSGEALFKVIAGFVVIVGVIGVVAYNGYVKSMVESNLLKLKNADRMIKEAYGNTRERDIGWAELEYKDTVEFIDLHKPYAGLLPAGEELVKLEREAYARLALLCMAQGRGDEAREWAGRYLEVAPESEADERRRRLQQFLRGDLVLSTSSSTDTVRTSR
jgi:hypothetical protein